MSSPSLGSVAPVATTAGAMPPAGTGDTHRFGRPGRHELRTPEQGQRTAASWFGRIVTIVGLALVAAVFLAAAIFRAGGGEWLNIETGSMGEAAPVGTLVLTRPATISDLAVGDIITYHPDGRANVTFTHRIIAITGDHVTTQGDNNGASDPWQIHQQDIVGKVVATWYGVGWLMRALPWLILGWALVWFASRRMSDLWRLSARLVGYPFVFAAVVSILRPFINMQSLTTTGLPGGAQVDVVSTGLMPIKVTIEGGLNAVHLVDGQMATLIGHDLTGNGRVDITGVPHLSLLWLVIVILVSAVPLVASLVVAGRMNKESSE